jgi:hypothetical protein
VSGGQIRLLVRQGVLVRVGHGVYARATLAAKVEGNPAGEQALSLASVLAGGLPGGRGCGYTWRRCRPVM